MFLENYRVSFHKIYKNNILLEKMKKELITPIVIIGIVTIILIFVFSGKNENTNVTEESNVINQIILNTELKDVRTGEKFKISDFSDKPVLLESFAVWCPTCTKQQQEIKKLHEEIGDDVISISLDTDPNEDENKIKEHIERNGFDWYYSISPIEFTQTLIDEFGIGIVNAPSAPVILICNNEARKLDSGVKDVDELKKELESCNI